MDDYLSVGSKHKQQMILRKKDTKKEFWDWFVKNKTKLEEFIKSDNRDYSTYNQLTNKLQGFNKLLFPEITIDENDNFVLIITPDGIKEGMIPTKEIVDSAPSIDNWVVKKYRQATDKMDLNFRDLEFKYDDIKIWRKFNIEEVNVDIAVLIRNFNEKDTRFISLAFLYLDHILGEYNVLSRVGQIDFLGWDKLSDKIETIDLLSLRKEIEDNLY